jgi:hypothetical protein
MQMVLGMLSWRKKTCNVFLTKAGFLLILTFALELLSNMGRISGDVVQGDLSSWSLCADSKSWLSTS